MSNTPPVSDQPMTAESMPMVRKGFKVFGQVAFVVIWGSAMLMTLSVMLNRAEGQAWWVALSLVTLGLGADFWVGAGPVILRSSAKWGIKGWVWIGWATLILALLFSYTNKVAFWVEDSNKRAAIHAVANVDTLATDMALVAANPNIRLPDAVMAERDAAAEAVAAKRQEIASLPPKWPVRRMRAQRELLVLQTARGKLASEYQTALKVSQAQERIDAAKDKDAARAAAPKDNVDPVVQWIIDLFGFFGIAITSTNALVFLHAAYAFFHEMAQFSVLGLATLRIPIHKMHEEVEFLVKQRQLRATKRSKLLAARMDEAREVSQAKAHFAATKAGIGEIAKERADLELSKQKREVVRERRTLHRLWQIEDDELAPVPEHMRIHDKRHEEVKAVDRGAIEAEWKDAIRSEAAKRGWDKRRRKVVVAGKEFETTGVREGGDKGAVDGRTASIPEANQNSPRGWLDMLSRQAENAAERRALRKLAEQASSEPAAAKSTLNAPYPEMETVEVEEPDDDIRVANESSDADSVRGAEQPGDDNARADAAELQVSQDHVSDLLAGPESAEVVEPKAADEVTHDEPQTVILDDDRFDEMVAKGQITEDGAPLPQDGAEVIEQPRDAEAEEFADKFGLPKPRSNGALEHMQ